jgi:hypothetical protein
MIDLKTFRFNIFLAALMLWGISGPVDSQNFQLIGQYEGSSHINDIYINDNYAYISTHFYRTSIIDIGEPTNPSSCGEIYMNDCGSGVRGIKNYLYTTYISRGLYIADVANPYDPIIIGYYNPPSFSLKLAVLGNYVYIANYADFKVVDVSDPRNPVLTGTYDTPDIAFDVAVLGDYAYIATSSRGLFILNISDPANPALAGNCDTPGRAQAVCVYKDYAYIADSDSGMQIIDIEDPFNPQLISNFPTPEGLFDISVSANYAFLAVSTAGLIICDITNPCEPTFAGRYAVSDTSFSVYVSGDHIYLSENRFLTILKFMPSETNFENNKYDYSLSQSYLNPLNNQAIINYYITNPGLVSLTVYNSLGQKIAVFDLGVQSQGPHRYIWNFDDYLSGLYHFQINACGTTINRKMMLSK